MHALLIDSASEQMRDVRMIERSQDLPFFEETIEGFRMDDARADHLQGYLTLGFVLPRQVYDPHPALAQQIADCLGVELGEANLREFANGEIHCRYEISIRGCDVFIIQTHCGPVNDSLMEQLIMIDAAKRASAKRITAS